MTWRKKGSKTEYLEFIRSIKGRRWSNPLRIPSFSGGHSSWIRHDVDKDLLHALKFAEYEAKNNIHSTYFLLHTAPYFDYSFDFKMKLRALSHMGHGVGFHNDVLSVWWDRQSGGPDITTVEEIEKALGFMREVVEVKGTSCHGAREHYKRGYFNYEIWKECCKEKNAVFGRYKENFVTYSLNEFDLHYEAYLLPYTHYFSDSGNNWIGYVVDGQKPFERTALESPNNLGSNVIEEFNKCKEGFLQVLTHPCHWEEIK